MGFAFSLYASDYPLLPPSNARDSLYLFSPASRRPRCPSKSHCQRKLAHSNGMELELYATVVIFEVYPYGMRTSPRCGKAEARHTLHLFHVFPQATSPRSRFIFAPHVFRM